VVLVLVLLREMVEMALRQALQDHPLLMQVAAGLALIMGKRQVQVEQVAAGQEQQIILEVLELLTEAVVAAVAVAQHLMLAALAVRASSSSKSLTRLAQLFLAVLRIHLIHRFPVTTFTQLRRQARLARR
jgi:hypothetical protein